MKQFRLKTLMVALAVAGFTSACDRDGVRRDAYTPPEQPPVENATTAPGTTNPGALSTMEDTRDINRSASTAAGVDHEETVQFRGTDLTDESEKKLEDLVRALDKTKPVAVIIAMEDPALDTNAMPGETGGTTGSASDPSLSNRGANPGAGTGAGTATDTATVRNSTTGAGATTGAGSTTTEGAQTESLFSQRADEVREFLRDQGVEVVQWQVEGSSNQQPPQQQDVQQVRIVIAAGQTGELSTL